jgi:hypothetical protein
LQGADVQLEKITAQVRPRPPWEAVDLGFLLIQRWKWTIYAGWLAVTLPVFVAINYFLHDRAFLAAIALWWLLPIFDRIPLHVISRGLFGERVTARSLLRDGIKIFVPHFIKSLTIYRFDPARTYNMPVWQLERQRGSARLARTRLLNKSQYANAAGLGLLCICAEIILFLGMFGLVLMFVPEYYSGVLLDTLFRSDSTWWAGPVVNVFVYLTFLIVEPFYVAGGFSLYINRRTELEGWDIEIIFRQLARRIKGLAQAALFVVSVSAVAQGVAIFSPQHAHAAGQGQGNSSPQAALSNTEAKKAIAEVMAAEEFNQVKKVSGWYLKQGDSEEQKQQQGGNSGFSLYGLSLLGETLALAGQLLLWLGVAALLAATVYYFLKWLPASAARQARKLHKDMPASLFGLEITPESLPDDVGGAALALWREGKVIDAMSLLYRGALATLVHRDGVNLKGSATEGDCIRIVTGHAGETPHAARKFFQVLTRQWQYAAYAHRDPDEKVMSELCAAWRQHFGARA